MQLPSREVRSKFDEYEREEQRLAKERKHMTIWWNNHTLRSLNFFNERFVIFLDSSISQLILSLHIDNRQKTMCHAY